MSKKVVNYCNFELFYWVLYLLVHTFLSICIKKMSENFLTQIWWEKLLRELFQDFNESFLKIKIVSFMIQTSNDAPY